MFTALNVGRRRFADSSYDVQAGFAQAFLFTLAVGAVLAVSTYVKLVRSIKQQLGAGTQLKAVWEPESLVVRHPLSEIKLPLATIEAVQVFQYWVAIRQTGSRRWLIWPRELFPDAALARLPVVGAEPTAG
jgi:hypothetical protein